MISNGVALWLAVFLLMCGASGALAGPGAVRSGDGRFIDHGDRTITDTQTGIMWMQQDSYQLAGSWLNWAESIEFVQKLNAEAFAGYVDWRVPSVNELKTLYEAGKVNSAQLGREMKIHIDPIFEREGAGALWSFEENGRFNGFGFIYNNGVRFSAPKTSKSRKAVRAMRHTQP